MKISQLLNINENRIYPKFRFPIIILSCDFWKKLNENTLNFDPDQYFRPDLENGPIDLDEIFTPT